MKIDAFHDVKGFLTHKAFKGQTYPQLLEDLMNLVKRMRFEEAPDYNLFRSLFRPYMPSRNNNFDNVEMGQNNNKENILYDIAEEDEIEFTQPIMKKPSKRRSLPLTLKRQQSVSQPWSPNQMQTYNDHRNQIIRTHCNETMRNPTPAMTEQLARMQKRSEGLLPNFFSPRRKGLVAKRRLGQRKNSTESNDTLSRLRTPRMKTPMKRGGPSVRRSPRRIEKSIGEHLYGIVAPGLGAVTSLVKSMFQVQRLRLRRQISK